MGRPPPRAPVDPGVRLEHSRVFRLIEPGFLCVRQGPALFGAEEVKSQVHLWVKSARQGHGECQAVSTVSKREVDQDEFQEILEEQGLQGQSRAKAPLRYRSRCPT